MKQNATTVIGDSAPVFDSDETDWARVAAMTPDEIMSGALADPDAQPLTPEQLARMRPFPDPVRIRGQLHSMTQQRFARLFQISLGALRDWEQRVHSPDSAAIALLRIIERDPLAAALALNPDLTAEELAPELGLTLPARAAASA